VSRGFRVERWRVRGIRPAILHKRLALPQVAIAALFRVRPETINKRIRDIRQLLDQAAHAIQPEPHRLASLSDLYRPSQPQKARYPS